MISNILPRLLRAMSTKRVTGEDEEEIDSKDEGVLSALVPERLNMSLLEQVPIKLALRALKRVCYRHNAKLVFSQDDIREADLNIPARAIVIVKGPGRQQSFKAILFVDGNFVSFAPLP